MNVTSKSTNNIDKLMRIISFEQWKKGFWNFTPWQSMILSNSNSFIISSNFQAFWMEKPSFAIVALALGK